MLLPSVLLLSLAAVTVANSAVECLNGGTPKPNSNRTYLESPCDCGYLFIGRYCGIPTKIFESHDVYSENYQKFTFEYFRNESLTEELALSSQQISIYQEFQTGNGRPIEVVIIDIGRQFDSLKDSDSVHVKLNGEPVQWYQPYRGHWGEDGKVVLEVTFPVGEEHFNIKALARAGRTNYGRCEHGGASVKTKEYIMGVQWDEYGCICPVAYTGERCEIPIEFTERYVIDSNNPMPIHINASRTELFKNNHIKRMAQFEFISKNRDLLRLIIDIIPYYNKWSPREDENNFQFVLSNMRGADSANKFNLIDETDPEIFEFTDQITLWVLFQYENKPDESSFVPGMEQLADFQFSADKK